MVNIKWRGKDKDKPFVYRSERAKTFKVVGYETIEKPVVKSVYLGTYRDYRYKRPNGTFDQIMTSKARLNMMSEHPERLKILHLIDETIRAEFERKRA